MSLNNFYLLKTLSYSGFEPQSVSRKSGSLTLSYRVILLQHSFLSFNILIRSSPRVCGHGRVLMAFSSSLQSLRIVILCREHIKLMLLVTGACRQSSYIAKRTISSQTKPFVISAVDSKFIRLLSKRPSLLISLDKWLALVKSYHISLITLKSIEPFSRYLR